jgi:tartrate-resistant acid phosphatase type 5
MGVVGQKLDIDFIISTGDNIYDDGIANTSDPLFKESFSNIYTAKSLQKPWYLGNSIVLYPTFLILHNIYKWTL